MSEFKLWPDPMEVTVRRVKRVKMTPAQIKKAVAKDKAQRLKESKARFWKWWHAQMDRDGWTPAEAALQAWLARFR